MTGIVDIDGARGEGGGQILRTSLALAMITGRALRMRKIRAGRAKPGLRRQHLACVEAAAQLCRAEVRGAQLSSQDLEFTPHTITGGELVIDIGTAGSTTLVIQTILIPAIVAGHPLRAVIRGGTHNPLAPPFEFLDRVYLPHLRAMGADVTASLDRHGFATGGRRDRRGTTEPRDKASKPGDAEPTGADEQGQITITIGANPALAPIDVVEAGPITRRLATAIVARLPTHVADREHAIVQAELGFLPAECTVREAREGGPANVLLVEIERAHPGHPHPIRELVSSLGEQGKRAELVARDACREMRAFLDADVPVGEYLADQLLLPLAVAGAGRFRAAPLSLHATTNIETIQRFLDVPITVTPAATSALVTVG